MRMFPMGVVRTTFLLFLEKFLCKPRRDLWKTSSKVLRMTVSVTVSNNSSDVNLTTRRPITYAISSKQPQRRRMPSSRALQRGEPGRRRAQAADPLAGTLDLRLPPDEDPV